MKFCIFFYQEFKYFKVCTLAGYIISNNLFSNTFYNYLIKHLIKAERQKCQNNKLQYYYIVRKSNLFLIGCIFDENLKSLLVISSNFQLNDCGFLKNNIKIIRCLASFITKNHLLYTFIINFYHPKNFLITNMKNVSS